MEVSLNIYFSNTLIAKEKNRTIKTKLHKRSKYKKTNKKEKKLNLVICN